MDFKIDPIGLFTPSVSDNKHVNEKVSSDFADILKGTVKSTVTEDVLNHSIKILEEFVFSGNRNVNISPGLFPNSVAFEDDNDFGDTFSDEKYFDSFDQESELDSEDVSKIVDSLFDTVINFAGANNESMVSAREGLSLAFERIEALYGPLDDEVYEALELTGVRLDDYTRKQV
jgi:hypothetical protein